MNTTLLRMIAASALAGSASVQAAGWTIIDLGSTQYVNSSELALNDNGWVVFGNRVLAPGATGYSVVAELFNTSGNTNSFALVDINNSNAVAGNDASAGYRQGFVWQAGVRTNLPRAQDYMGYWSSTAGAINNAGAVVGHAGDYATRWNPGAGYSSMTVLGANVGWTIGSGAGVGINDSGQGLLSAVYPYYRPGYLDGVVDARTSEPSTLMPVVPGYQPSGRAINDSNIVVGDALYDCHGFSCTHPFVWEGNTVTMLPVATVDDSWPVTGNARSINDAGQVVGNAYFQGYDSRADLWTETAGGWVQTDLNTLLPAGSPFWKLADALDINNKGQIVGLGFVNDDPSVAHVFLLTPVPEPHTWSMILAGLLAVGQIARRRLGRVSAGAR